MARFEAAQTMPGTPRTSWRVNFAYSNDDIRLVSAMRVVMIAPGGAAPTGAPNGKNSGAWIEVRDAKSGVHWIRTIHQPNRGDIEVTTESGPFARVIRHTVEGEFELIVPDLGPDAVLILYASPAHAPAEAASARVKLELSELARLERAGPPATGKNSKPGSDGTRK